MKVSRIKERNIWWRKRDHKPISNYNEIRQRNHKFYLSIKWKKCRLLVLSENPICVDCHLNSAEEVHHQHPLYTSIGWENRLNLYDDLGNLNLIALCKSCHSIRTKAEEQERKQQLIQDRHKYLDDYNE